MRVGNTGSTCSAYYSRKSTTSSSPLAPAVPLKASYILMKKDAIQLMSSDSKRNQVGFQQVQELIQIQ